MPSIPDRISYYVLTTTHFTVLLLGIGLVGIRLLIERARQKILPLRRYLLR